ncbi:hypothetical protein B6N60_05122 [Richelia sinica FACHB-800]|uniref:Uncharacterized protein n=1 Tax=Richelia sinica FACHB-800 TaxID=1357546 RepID=A0A975TDB8_9NOST|nr:hypothetical protein B6N60_05122 [Richelia sinica FACHB-800]
MGVAFVISKKLCDRFLCKDSRIQKWQMFSESDRTGITPQTLFLVNSSESKITSPF